MVTKEGEKEKFLSMSVGEIAHLLYFGENRAKKLGKTLVSGRKIHEELGFNQEEKARRLFRLKNGIFVLVGGKPDKLVFNKKNNNLTIEELKTFFGKEQRNIQREVAKLQLQIYLLLFDLSCGKIILYDLKKRKIVEEEEYELNQTFALDAIEDAFKIHKLQVGLKAKTQALRSTKKDSY